MMFYVCSVNDKEDDFYQKHSITLSSAEALALLIFSTRVSLALTKASAKENVGWQCKPPDPSFISDVFWPGNLKRVH